MIIAIICFSINGILKVGRVARHMKKGVTGKVQQSKWIFIFTAVESRADFYSEQKKWLAKTKGKQNDKTKLTTIFPKIGI